MELKNYDYDVKNEIAEYKNCNKDDLYKFLVYKATAKNLNFDCDSCDYAKEIYKNLWGYDSTLNYKSNYRNIQIGTKSISMAPDTMNSFWTTFAWCLNKWCSKDIENKLQIKYVTEKDVEKLAKNYDILKQILINNLSNDIFEKILLFAKLTHTIGNFILVPRNLSPYTTEDTFFNSARSNLYCDYFDLSLHCFFNNNEINWDYSTAKIYFNHFFLQDYVNENGEILALTENHDRIIRNNQYNRLESRPQSILELDTLLDSIITRITRRGQIMYGLLSDSLPPSFKSLPQKIHTKEFHNESCKGQEKLFFAKSLIGYFVMFFLVIGTMVGEILNDTLHQIGIYNLPIVIEWIYNLAIIFALPLGLAMIFANKSRKKYMDAKAVIPLKKEISIPYISIKTIVIIYLICLFAVVILSEGIISHIENHFSIDSYIRDVLLNILYILPVGCIMVGPVLFFGYRRRCRNCKKHYMLKKKENKKIYSDDISIKVENKIEDNDGRVIQREEQYVPGEKTVYKQYYKCKACGQVHYTKFYEERIK